MPVSAVSPAAIQKTLDRIFRGLPAAPERGRHLAKRPRPQRRGETSDAASGSPNRSRRACNQRFDSERRAARDGPGAGWLIKGAGARPRRGRAAAGDHHAVVRHCGARSVSPPRSGNLCSAGAAGGNCGRSEPRRAHLPLGSHYHAGDPRHLAAAAGVRVEPAVARPGSAPRRARVRALGVATAAAASRFVRSLLFGTISGPISVSSLRWRLWPCWRAYYQRSGLLALSLKSYRDRDNAGGQ